MCNRRSAGYLLYPAPGRAGNDGNAGYKECFDLWEARLNGAQGDDDAAALFRTHEAFDPIACARPP